GERGSSDPSRWSSGRDLEWVSLRPELVVEIDFDHISAGRIRHGAKLRRWREDKPPRDCTVDQLASSPISDPRADRSHTLYAGRMSEQGSTTATVAEEEYLQIRFWLRE